MADSSPPAPLLPRLLLLATLLTTTPGPTSATVLEGALGQGWVLDHDIVLADATVVPDSIRLLLPPNSRINFAKQPDGRFTAEGDPRFRGAVLTLNTVGERSWDLTFKDGARWHFGQCDPTGVTACFLLQTYDPAGNVTQITRRTDHKITSISAGDSSAPGTRGYTLAYGASGYVETITDPLGRRLAFTYNADKRLDTYTDAEGGITRFTYVNDSEFPAEPLCPQSTDGLRIKTITYPGKTLPTDNSHGPSRRVLRQTTPDGRVLDFDYELTGACVTHVNTPGELCTGPTCPNHDSWVNYQAGWRIHGGQVVATTVIDGEGVATTKRFGGTGLATQTTDPQGQTTTHTRDEQNRITRTTDPLGRATSTLYDGKSNPSLITDPLGRQTYIEYDPLYNKPSLIRRWLDDGTPVDTVLIYGPGGVVKSLTDPEQHTTRFTHTPQGQLETVTDPLDHVVRYGYNPQGDLTTLTDPLGHTTTLSPDAVGRPEALTTPLGHTARTAYTALDQVKDSTDPMGGKTTTTFDAAHRPQSLIDPLQHTPATWGYDDGDRLTSRLDAHGREEGYSYDAAGRLETRTDRQGRATYYHYDAAGRLAQENLPDRTVNHTYDALGNLIQVEDGNSRITYTYDAVDRLTREEQDSGRGATRLDYQYDSLDRLTRRTVSGPDLTTPDVTDYQWDKAGRLQQISHRGQTTRYTWDAAGRLDSKTLPNGVVSDYDWDAAGRLTKLTHSTSTGTVLDTLEYGYDADGRRTSLTHSGHGTAPETPMAAEYDPANRLTSLTLNPTTTPQTYTLAYDDHGNLSSKTRADGQETTTYTWDASDRLTRLERTGEAPLTAEFKYDVLDRRIERTITRDNTPQTTRYLYDGPQAIAEVRDGQVTSLLTGLMIDEAIARYGTTESRTQLTDALGSILALAKEDGTLATSYGYSPYGETSQSGEGSDNASQYTGRENDGTGLYFYRARYYDAGLKRFISEDPIGIAGGINEYAYVGGDPISFRDPSGLVVDTLVDLGFLAHDLYRLYKDGPCERAANLQALGLDALGVLIPGVTGLGAASRGSKSAGQGLVIIGETMARVEAAAAKYPGAKILNNMPDFKAMGMSPDQVTSAMMQYNRKWILEQIRSGRQIIDIGADANRARPSIFYQMEQKMLKNYQKLHPEFGGAVSP